MKTELLNIPQSTQVSQRKLYKAKFAFEFFKRKKIPSYALWAVYKKDEITNKYPKIPTAYGRTDTLEQAMLDLTSYCEKNNISSDDIRNDMVPWMLVKQMLGGMSGAEWHARQVVRRGSKRDVAVIDSSGLVHRFGDKAMTSSLTVAEKFKKLHKNVLRAIEKLPRDEFHRLNFEPTIRPVNGPKGSVRKERAYEMTWKGFSMLVMGFTGKEAYLWKQNFLDAFEFMGSEIDRRTVEIQPKRDSAKHMMDGLLFARDELGKATLPHHYANEHKFVNRACFEKYEAIDESILDVYDTRLLRAARERNTLLIQRFPKQESRKQMLDDFVSEYRKKYPRLTVVKAVECTNTQQQTQHIEIKPSENSN